MAKNIVLLSDGTGNSAAKLFMTNVWRFYQALDLSRPERNKSRSATTAWGRPPSNRWPYWEARSAGG